MAQSENSARERILARIRDGLRVPVRMPPSPSDARPQVFEPIRDPLERFQRECAENNTECIVAQDAKQAVEAVDRVLESLPPGEVFVQDAPYMRRFAQRWQQSRSIRWSNDGVPAESSQATITLAECLVAQTGSVFVSAECGGRGASVVAPVHVVVATVAQLVPDLEAAFTRLRERGTASRNSFVCLITGCSRTGDIEKTLVLGAHGPRRLVAVLALQSMTEDAGGSTKAQR